MVLRVSDLDSRTLGGKVESFDDAIHELEPAAQVIACEHPHRLHLNAWGEAPAAVERMRALKARLTRIARSIRGVSSAEFRPPRGQRRALRKLEPDRHEQISASRLHCHFSGLRGLGRRARRRTHSGTPADAGAGRIDRRKDLREHGDDESAEPLCDDAQATAAGYFQYTDEDQTGAISWVNIKSWQSDEQHPSQLWYDVSGRLIGADFSVLQSNSKARPEIWGISPSRWLDFSPGHVHFGIKTASGVAYGGAGAKTMAKIEGTVNHPTSADIVKIGTLPRYKVLKIPAAKTASDVAFVFPFPAIWDLQVWLVPNPLGAFAEHNPDVKPSANAKDQD